MSWYAAILMIPEMSQNLIHRCIFLLLLVITLLEFAEVALSHHPTYYSDSECGKLKTATSIHYEMKDYTVMVNTFNNINKTSNHLSPQIIENKNDIGRW